MSFSEIDFVVRSSCLQTNKHIYLSWTTSGAALTLKIILKKNQYVHSAVSKIDFIADGFNLFRLFTVKHTHRHTNCTINNVSTLRLNFEVLKLVTFSVCILMDIAVIFQVLIRADQSHLFTESYQNPPRLQVDRWWASQKISPSRPGWVSQQLLWQRRYSAARFLS